MGEKILLGRLEQYSCCWLYGFTVFSGVYNSRILRIDFLDVYWNLIAGGFSFLKVLLSYQKDVDNNDYVRLLSTGSHYACFPQIRFISFVFFKAFKIQLLSYLSLAYLIMILYYEFFARDNDRRDELYIKNSVFYVKFFKKKENDVYKLDVCPSNLIFSFLAPRIQIDFTELCKTFNSHE